MSRPSREWDMLSNQIDERACRMMSYSLFCLALIGRKLSRGEGAVLGWNEDWVFWISLSVLRFTSADSFTTHRLSTIGYYEHWDCYECPSFSILPRVPLSAHDHGRNSDQAGYLIPYIETLHNLDYSMCSLCTKDPFPRYSGSLFSIFVRFQRSLYLLIFRIPSAIAHGSNAVRPVSLCDLQNYGKLLSIGKDILNVAGPSIFFRCGGQKTRKGGLHHYPRNPDSSWFRNALPAVMCFLFWFDFRIPSESWVQSLGAHILAR